MRRRLTRPACFFSGSLSCVAQDLADAPGELLLEIEEVVDLAVHAGGIDDLSGLDLDDAGVDRVSVPPRSK